MWLEILRTISVPSRGDPTSGQLGFWQFQQSWRLLVILTAPSKLGFQVEVTLLEDHRLPTGTARE
jgi:hypothetical protein